jgi:hypothetical protein
MTIPGLGPSGYQSAPAVLGAHTLPTRARPSRFGICKRLHGCNTSLKHMFLLACPELLVGACVVAAASLLYYRYGRSSCCCRRWRRMASVGMRLLQVGALAVIGILLVRAGTARRGILFPPLLEHVQSSTSAEGVLAGLLSCVCQTIDVSRTARLGSQPILATHATKPCRLDCCPVVVVVSAPPLISK